MSLADEARALARRAGGTCAVGTLLAAADKKLVAELREALADPALSATAIALALKRRELDLAASALRRHRRRECRCDDAR